MALKIALKPVACGAGIGLLAAAAFAAVPTAMDWRVNPGNLFHSGGHTNWPIVFDTWFSWFDPLALVAVPLASMVCLWLAMVDAGETPPGDSFRARQKEENGDECAR